MSKFDLLDMLLETHKGILRTSDVIEAGISKTYFSEYVSKRELGRISHGIYLSKDAWEDSMYIVQLRFPQAVFSHETALFLHDLTDREPIQYSVTLKTGYNTAKLQEMGLSVHLIKKELHPVGIIEVTSPFGHLVKTYDAERTICDILRSRNQIEIQVFQDALKHYFRQSDKNLRLLMQYAKLFHVERILTPYLEVLI